MFSHSRHANTRFERVTVPFLALVFFVILPFFVYTVFFDSPDIVSPIPGDVVKKKFPLTFFFQQEKKKDPEALRATIVALASASWKNYSVAIYDLRGDFSLTINEQAIYQAASVNKLPILAALYYEVQKGTISLSDTVTLQRKDIQDYGTGSMRYDKPGSTYSIQTLAKLAIQQSDNTAAYILANYTLGLDTIQTLIESWGLTQTDMTANTTSNKDMAILLEKMYHGKITNKALTQEMLGYMKDTDFEERLPALLPESVTVYHKIGNGTGNIHDVGIVESEATAYSIGILTSDITDEKQAESIEANISKAVYEFMSAK